MEDLVINSYDLNGFNFNDISQLMQVRLLDEDYSNSEENGSTFFLHFFNLILTSFIYLSVISFFLSLFHALFHCHFSEISYVVTTKLI